MIELIELDEEMSKPAPTLGSKNRPEKPDSAGSQLRNAEDELDDEDRSAYCIAAGTLLNHTLNKSDIKFLRLLHVRVFVPKSKASGTAQKHCQGSRGKAGVCLAAPPTKIVAFTDADWDRRISTSEEHTSAYWPLNFLVLQSFPLKPPHILMFISRSS